MSDKRDMDSDSNSTRMESPEGVILERSVRLRSLREIRMWLDRVQNELEMYLERGGNIRVQPIEFDQSFFTTVQESSILNRVPLQPVPDVILKELPIMELDKDKLIKYNQCPICLEIFVLKEKSNQFNM